LEALESKKVANHCPKIQILYKLRVNVCMNEQVWFGDSSDKQITHTHFRFKKRLE